MIRIILLGKVVPKARPRFSSRGHVHMPPKYAEWKESAVIDLMNTRFVAIGKVSLEITFINAIRGNADCDNAAGSIMDALVKSGVLCGDSAATISDDLLTKLDETCWQNRMNRSKFVCEAVAAYIEKLDKVKGKKSESIEN